MKIELGAKNYLYPVLITLVGANVKGKPNYITIGHVGIVGPSNISVNMGKRNFTNDGIKENGTFSVNIPSVQMVKETDYCGLVSGRDVDKAALFTTFYGKLKTAPMIEECPICMECRLVKTIDFPAQDVFIGEVVATYSGENVLTDDLVDFSKVQPILGNPHDASYWRLGDRFAMAWSVGKTLESRK